MITGFSLAEGISHPALSRDHAVWFPAFAGDIPYNVVQVELEEGPRLTANVVDVSNEELEIGLPVQIVVGEALPRFRVAR